MGDGGEFNEIFVALCVFGQNHLMVTGIALFLVGDVAVNNVHLVADDRLNGFAPSQFEQFYGSAHHPVVGKGNGGHL